MPNDEQISSTGSLSWAAHHASMQRRQDFMPALISLLPLFPDKASSAAMIRHSMDVIKKAVNILNPGQVPVIAFDQPLFAIAKAIQWNWKDTHGESHFVIMFGGLHCRDKLMIS